MAAKLTSILILVGRGSTAPRFRNFSRSRRHFLPLSNGPGNFVGWIAAHRNRPVPQHWGMAYRDGMVSLDPDRPLSTLAGRRAIVDEIAELQLHCDKAQPAVHAPRRILAGACPLRRYVGTGAARRVSPGPAG
jgi:hypothetical protein